MRKNQNQNIKTRGNQIYNALVIIGLSLLLDLILFGVFGKAGAVVKKFLLGVFGFSIYAFGLSSLLVGVLMLLGKKPSVSGRVVFNYVVMLLLTNAMFHIILTQPYNNLGYLAYIKYCYSSASTAGGVLAGCLLYPLVKIYVLSMIFLALFLVGIISLAIVGQAKTEIEFKIFNRQPKKAKVKILGGNKQQLVQEDSQKTLYNATISGKPLPDTFGKGRGGEKKFVPIEKIDNFVEEQEESHQNEENYEFLVNPNDVEIEIQEKRQKALDFLYSADDVVFSQKDGLTIDASNTISQLNIDKQYKQNADLSNSQVDGVGIDGEKNAIDKNVEKNKQINSKYQDSKYSHYFNDHRKNQLKKNLGINNQDDLDNDLGNDIDRNGYDEESENDLDSPYFIDDMEMAMNQLLKNNSLIVDKEIIAGGNQDQINQEEYEQEKSIDIEQYESQNNAKSNENFVERLKNIQEKSNSNKPYQEDCDKKINNEKVRDLFSKNNDSNNGGVYDNYVSQAFGIKTAKVKKNKKYFPPDLSCLNDYDENIVDSTNIDEKVQILETKMQENGIDIVVEKIVRGPRFTRIEFSTNSPLSKISAKVNDITMWLSVKSLRLLTPITGTPYCGVEIPNQKSGTVGLKAIINSPSFNNTKDGALVFALGKDIDGKCYVPDICKFPHGLIAGASGAGKSVSLNAMLCSMLYKYSPEQLRMILVDPKEVEFNIYSDIPHLLLPKIISDEKATINALRWAVGEMDKRYTLLKNNQVTNIEQYNNEIAINGQADKLPWVLIVIDEVGDIILSSVGKEFEALVKKLAAKARAAGIHLILATQRPTVDVITGTIKANLPTRIAFAVTSFTDSNSILDSAGAEKLLRNGDMLYKDSTDSNLYRVQGCFIHTSEVRAIVTQVKQNNDCDFDPLIEEAIFKTEEETQNIQIEAKKPSIFPDDLCPDVLEVCLGDKVVSISKLQRKFGIGFPRAAKIFDWLKEMEYLQQEGKQNVFVLTAEQVEEIKNGDIEE